MSDIKTTGNAIVDAMGTINVTGNIVPLSWFKKITYDSGRPDYAGAMILADLVYWYRPSKIVDENSGNIRWKKKFKSDLVQMGYAQIQERFNLTHNQAAAALSRLEKLGLLKRHFRTLLIGGTRCNNVMYLEIFPDKIAEITYKINDDNSSGEVLDCNDIPMEIYSHMSEDEMAEMDVYACTPGVIEPQTNTESITKNIKKDYPYITQIREQFKDHIDYESLLIDYPFQKDQINEIVDIATEVLTSEKETITVNGEKRPAEYVKERYRKLGMESIGYVLDSLREYKNGATNIRAFLITTLFNAASTVDTYMGVKVNHDMAVNA